MEREVKGGKGREGKGRERKGKGVFFPMKWDGWVRLFFLHGW